MTTAYVYKWTHVPTMKWYVGSHNGSRRNYICSSKYVKEQIKLNSSEWERTIVETGTYEEMLSLETEMLQLFDARNDSRSYNRHNNEGCPGMMGGPLTQKTKDKIGAANKGKSNPFKGIPRSQEVRDAIKKATTGVKKSTTVNSNTKIIVECPHCKKAGSQPAMMRWHFNNCKEKELCL